MTSMQVSSDPAPQPNEHTEAASAAWSPSTSRSRWRFVTDPTSVVPVLFGVALTLVGFALMIVAWAAVAGQTDVWRQFPYLLSAGLPGLALVMVGLVLVNIALRRQDAAERARQASTLADAIRELQRAIDR